MHSDRFEQVIALLARHKVKLEEEEIAAEPEEDKTRDRRKLIYSDRETSVDDPIRLYLREIGKENLLTAEQEVELSKRMEDGENAIRAALRGSGTLARELVRLVQKREPADSRGMVPAPRRPGMPPREGLRPRSVDLRRPHLHEEIEEFLEEELEEPHRESGPKRVDLRPEDIAPVAEKLAGIARRVRSLQREQARIQKRLKADSPREVKALAKKAGLERDRGDRAPPPTARIEQLRAWQANEGRLERYQAALGHTHRRPAHPRRRGRARAGWC